jgi:nitroimidazol reductase NimA-like FMN-containing flavoprotein (pyridoxamine 5'-phosphate oxidase superfamily)
MTGAADALGSPREGTLTWLEELEQLTTSECLELLRTRQLGRVGFQLGDLPVILPVNYRVMANAVLFRTAPGTKLNAALMRAPVAFEVDDVAINGLSGWSVLVVGRAAELSEQACVQEAEALGVSPWAPGSREHFVVISAEEVSGRRFARS